MWQCILDVVQICSQIIGMFGVIAGVYIAYQTLIRTSVQEATPGGKSAKEEIENLVKLKVFDTNKQTTWLKVTDKGLECHLEDIRQGKIQGLQWTLTKEQISSILLNNEYKVYSGY